MNEIIKRICIVCRGLKDKFNEEHIIPKSIGGNLVINSICYDCNKAMGDNIDTPFVNHKQILLHRHNYQLHRDGRKIKNPFSGRHVTENGETVIVQIDGAGFFYNYIPQMHFIQTENGVVGKLTIGEKLFKSDEKLIKKYSDEFEKTTGMPVSFHTIKRYEEPNQITITITSENNDFIFGCVKIAYESAVTCIPTYYFDELAIVYSKMLVTGRLNKDYVEYINPKDVPIEILTNKLNQNSAINNFHCAIAITNIENIGLLAYLKIFDMKYWLVLSRKTDYLDDRVILILNDNKNGNLYLSIIKNISAYQLFFHRVNFSDAHLKEIEDNYNCIEKIFKNTKNEVSLFDKDGKILADNVMVLHTLSKWNIDFDLLSVVKKFNLKLDNGFFVKSIKSNLLYELAEINFMY